MNNYLGGSSWRLLQQTNTCATCCARLVLIWKKQKRAIKPLRNVYEQELLNLKKLLNFIEKSLSSRKKQQKVIKEQPRKLQSLLLKLNTKLSKQNQKQKRKLLPVLVL